MKPKKKKTKKTKKRKTTKKIVDGYYLPGMIPLIKEYNGQGMTDNEYLERLIKDLLIRKLGEQ